MDSSSSLFSTSSPLSPEVLKRGVPKISPEDVEACDTRWPIRHFAEELIRQQFTQDYPQDIQPVVENTPTVDAGPYDMFAQQSSYPALQASFGEKPTDIDVARAKVREAMQGRGASPDFSNNDFLNASGF